MFLLKLEMIGRWISMDKEKGSELFRQIIDKLKDELSLIHICVERIFLQ